MIRVFTTTFLYDQRGYEAMVSLVHVHGQMRYSVRIFHSDLQDLIPNGEIRYTGKDGHKDLGWIVDERSKELLAAVSAAIEAHLEGAFQITEASDFNQSAVKARSADRQFL